MNDFTKEELELIAECVEADFYRTNWARTMYDLLITKIQSMIDDYCEHESDEHCYYPDGIKCTDFLTYACSESPCFLKCKKCKELYK